MAPLQMQKLRGATPHVHTAAPTRLIAYCKSFTNRNNARASVVVKYANMSGATVTSRQTAPTAAETARTVVDICREGTLCTVSADGVPLGTPVTYALDKDGNPLVMLPRQSLELSNLGSDARCSLQVQPTTFPARAVASVTLIGKMDVSNIPSNQAAEYTLHVHKCLYFGGLDIKDGHPVEVSGTAFRQAQPDVLRRSVQELIKGWNEERAEDVYRIVSNYLKAPLTEMTYAELLWVDHLGMYVHTEWASDRKPGIYRVPFYRPAIDERDVRSVITMAAQMAWEGEHDYTPSVPAIFADAAAGAPGRS